MPTWRCGATNLAPCGWPGEDRRRERSGYYPRPLHEQSYANVHCQLGRTLSTGRQRGGSVDTEYAKAIANWYPDFKANFIEARFMNWPSEKWTGAGYAFPAPGEVTTVGPLLQQAHARRIHFAGEHCCYAFVGYMEGALNSGARTVTRLAIRDGHVKPDNPAPREPTDAKPVVPAAKVPAG